MAKISSSKNNAKIGIIGAGIAGIYAAKTLYQNGFNNLTIFEAANRIGGRIWSFKHDADKWIEFGAQWIHGQNDNCLYEYAQSRNLLADPIEDHGVEGAGYYCNEYGQIIDNDLSRRLIEFLDEKKNHMHEAFDSDQNVFDYFVDNFNQFISDNRINESSINIETLKHVFRWYVIFEVIDNSCHNLQTLSPLSYIEWQDCDGVVDLINFRHNYSSVLNEMAKDFPLNQLLRLNTIVDQIRFETTTTINDDKKTDVILSVNNNNNNSDEYRFDHVIITSSIGFLKHCLNDQQQQKFFSFKFPDNKRKIIDAIGFGTINKVFIEFEQRFWNNDCKGIQCVWTTTEINDDHSYPSSKINIKNGSSSNKLPQWVYCIQGFDIVRNNSNMLMAWIGSYGAIQMENYSDQEISKIMVNVLTMFMPKQCLNQCKSTMINVKNIYCTRWFSNPFVRGSYSNRTESYSKLDHCDNKSNNKSNHHYNIDALVEPICDSFNKPLLLFAGEATDRHHYSTTHGAMKSGERESLRLISYYQS